ncbi:MAG: tetratricopeptide repeat protein [Terriglobia bacterium]|jgi:tetratricopeptide (TPR) repeat protein
MLPPRRSRQGLRVVLLVAGLVILGAESATAQEWKTLVGEVRTERDQEITSDVTVIVQAFDGTRITQTHTDSQGHFEVPELVGVSYTLLVSAEGYHPLVQTVDLRQEGSIVNVKLILTRRRQAGAPAPLPPALTDLSASKKARKAFQKGVRALNAGNLGDARSQFEAAVAEYPCYARAQTGLAATLRAAEDGRGAEAALRKAMQCDPGFIDAYISLGQVLSGEKRFAESEAVLNQGLRLSPSNWQLYDKLAAVHYSTGQYAKAEKEWLEVRSLNPSPSPELHAKLGTTYLKEGVNDKAYVEMQAYLREDANGRFVHQIKALMQRIEASGALPGAEKPPR